MSENISKVCPYCAEQISAAAKICPRCKQWLSVYSLRNPAVFGAIFLLCFLTLAIGFLIFLNRVADPGIDFSPYRNGISVVESHMNLKEAGKDSSVYVVAVVTNQTDIAWKQIQFEARFFNKAGMLIDARTCWDSSTIFPHGESAVRINVTPSHALSDYDSYKLFVRFARDARSRF